MAKGSLRVNGIIVDTDGEIKASTGDSTVIREDDGSAVITVDTNGKTSIGGPMDVGVDDTGHDVKFFGATSGSYMLWDESTDDLIVQGGNVGIGATLENWGGHSVLAIGTGGNLAGRNYDSSDTAIELTENSYSTGGNTDSLSKYMVNGEATAFRLQAGKHKFLVASSGTADASITWTTAMTIDNSGNLGIGTTSPNSKLEVAGTMVSGDEAAIRLNNLVGGSNQIFRIQAGVQGVSHNMLGIYDVTDTTYRMVIDTDGKVGIGTTAPAQLLDIVSATSSKIRMENTGDAGTTIIMDADRSTEDGGLGSVVFYWNGTAVASVGGQSGPDTVNKDDGKLIFSTATSGGSRQTRMTIDDTGKIGIGTTAPGAPLDIGATHSYNTSASNHADGLRLTNASTGNMSIEWWHSTGSGTEFASIVGQTDDAGSNTYDDGNIVFRTKYDGTMADRMLIQSDGKVGIGSTNPGYKLTIDDNAETSLRISNSRDGSGSGTLRVAGTVSSYTASTRLIVLDYENMAHSSAMIFMQFESSAGVKGRITSSGTTTLTYSTSSDYRLKENQETMTNSISRLKKLKPYRFNFKDEPDRTMDGFFAHEVSDIVPVAVTGKKDEVDKDGKIVPQGIDHSKLVPLLVASVQELSAKNDVLEEKVKALENAG